jgi:hypothetical protein
LGNAGIGKKYGDEIMLIDTYIEHFLPSGFLQKDHMFSKYVREGKTKKNT